MKDYFKQMDGGEIMIAKKDEWFHQSPDSRIAERSKRANLS